MLQNSSTKTHGCSWIFSWVEPETGLQTYPHHQLVIGSPGLGPPSWGGGVSWISGGTPLTILLNVLQERKLRPGRAVYDCVLSAKIEYLGFEPRFSDTVLSETPQ